MSSDYNDYPIRYTLQTAPLQRVRLSLSAALKKYATFIAWLGVAAVLVCISMSPWSSGFADKPSRGSGDLELYISEVDQLQAGGNYYDIAAHELVKRGYPTKSIFNWRTPLPMSLIAILDTGVAKLFLGAIAIGMVLLALPGLYHAGGLWSVLLGTIALMGTCAPVWLADAWYMPEVWSGLLLGLSLAAHSCERRQIAVLSGMAALFFRELAAPYVVICIVKCWREKRIGELICWLIGCIIYSGFYSWHVHNVLSHIPRDAFAHKDSWLAFGGVAFLISLVQMNLWLLTLPQWMSAVALVLTLIGWSAAQSDWERRVAATGIFYLIVFGFIGMPINQYWGSQIAPVVALGFAQFPKLFNSESYTTPAAVAG